MPDTPDTLTRVLDRWWHFIVFKCYQQLRSCRACFHLAWQLNKAYLWWRSLVWKSFHLHIAICHVGMGLNAQVVQFRLVSPIESIYQAYRNKTLNLKLYRFTLPSYTHVYYVKQDSLERALNVISVRMCVCACVRVHVCCLCVRVCVRVYVRDHMCMYVLVRPCVHTFVCARDTIHKICFLGQSPTLSLFLLLFLSLHPPPPPPPTSLSLLHVSIPCVTVHFVCLSPTSDFDIFWLLLHRETMIFVETLDYQFRNIWACVSHGIQQPTRDSTHLLPTVLLYSISYSMLMVELQSLACHYICGQNCTIWRHTVFLQRRQRATLAILTLMLTITMIQI